MFFKLSRKSIERFWQYTILPKRKGKLDLTLNHLLLGSTFSLSVMVSSTLFLSNIRNSTNAFLSYFDSFRGYMAPEYAMRGHLTSKADVYSFGVVALEIVSGKSNTNYKPQEEFVYLLDWVTLNLYPSL